MPRRQRVYYYPEAHRFSRGLSPQTRELQSIARRHTMHSVMGILGLLLLSISCMVVDYYISSPVATRVLQEQQLRGSMIESLSVASSETASVVGHQSTERAFLSEDQVEHILRTFDSEEDADEPEGDDRERDEEEQSTVIEKQRK